MNKYLKSDINRKHTRDMNHSDSHDKLRSLPTSIGCNLCRAINKELNSYYELTACPEVHVQIK